MIRTLYLKNFKCFKDQVVDFGGITLLAGLNGMGKSTIIQSIVLLRQSYLQALLPSTGLLLNGELIRLGLAQDLLYEGAGSEDKIGLTLWSENQDKTEIEANWSFTYNQEADVLQIRDKPHSAIYDTSLFTDNFHYLQAERIGPRSGFQTSDFQVRQHRQIGPQGEYSFHFLSVFGDEDILMPELSHQKATSQSLRNQVEAWLGEISPGIRIHPTYVPDLDQVSNRYSYVVDQIESNRYRSINVGFGITYILPILVAVLFSSPGALVLIENPEAHIHPQGQTMIGYLLARAASYGIQIVLETHSDHVLNGIRLAVHDQVIESNGVMLHYFERRVFNSEVQHHIISPQIDRNGRIDEWPNGFFGQSNKDLLRLMKPR